MKNPKWFWPITDVFDKIEHDELEECIADLKEKLEGDFSREILEIIKQIINSRVGTLVNNWQNECKVEFSPECIKEIIMRVQNWVVEELQEVRLPNTWFNNGYKIW